MRNPDQIWLDNPDNHGFHDAHIVSIKIVPAKSVRLKNKVEVILSFYAYDKLFCIDFIDCLNLFTSIDFDLPDCGTCCVADFSTIKSHKAIEHQLSLAKNYWTIAYLDDPTNAEGPTFSYSTDPSPLQDRIDSSIDYILFRIRIFSGTLSVIAKSHKIRRVRKITDSQKIKRRRA